MGLLKKKKKKIRGAAILAAADRRSAISPLRPQAVDKLPPCVGHCPSGNDIRGWLTVIAQREKHGPLPGRGLRRGLAASRSRPTRSRR